jgi:hypothetical protein
MRHIPSTLYDTVLCWWSFDLHRCPRQMTSELCWAFEHTARNKHHQSGTISKLLAYLSHIALASLRQTCILRSKHYITLLCSTVQHYLYEYFFYERGSQQMKLTPYKAVSRFTNKNFWLLVFAPQIPQYSDGRTMVTFICLDPFRT